MRRVAAVVLALVAAVLPARAQEVPYLPRACDPVGPLDVARTSSCMRIRYVYGPLHVTPGDNLIMLGPVSIEKPPVPGWVVRFRADLEYLDGSIPPIETVHLHHAVWISTRYGSPIFATGEEKTVLSMPNGYGIRVEPYDVWALNYMLHNQTPVPQNVFVVYELDFVPALSGESLQPVAPHWLNVVGYNGANPVYNTQRGFGAVGECAFPREECAGFDPYGRTVTANGKDGNGRGHVERVGSGFPAGTIVFMAGHVHPGGLRLEVDIDRPAADPERAFVSRAVYFDPGGPISWDMAMEVTRPEFRLQVHPGDELVVNSVYETAQASWYEGMGIVVTYVAEGVYTEPDAGGPDAVGVTHGVLAEAQNHGGPDAGGSVLGSPQDTTTVDMMGFQYVPGGFGTGRHPVVTRGTPITFRNLDAPAAIYHTVTACRYPCDGPTGVSYPLANGEPDFDSLELGYGVPGATPAANRYTWSLQTASLDPGAYTYFCRIHPFMRGVLEVR